MNTVTGNWARVEDMLRALRARQRRVMAGRWMVTGLLVGALCGCGVVALAWSLAGVNGGALGLIGAGCILAGGLGGLVLGYLRRVNDLALARAVDRAAQSQDRFASAVQLAGHRQQTRVNLVIDDATERVRGVSPAAALPVRLPRTLRWIPVPLAVLALLLLALPSGRLQAGPLPAPEISADNWEQIERAFKQDLEKLPRPLTPQEHELRKQLEDLARMLAEKPDKKEALAEIARLSERVAEQRQALGARAISMKSAAKAVSSSKLLQSFASRLKEGEYHQAAGELKKLAEKLKEQQEAPDAEEMEAMAADLQRLAEQMEQNEEMQEECEKCAGSAQSLNAKALTEALKRLAEQMEKNSECQGQCDKLGQCADMLEELKRMMNQCRAGEEDEEGLCPKPGNKKGGARAGWGTAAKWDGGTLKKGAEDPATHVATVQERQGTNTTFHTVSPNERAHSGLAYKELYAEFVQKSEADLDLESVPVAYRDYLRRYFKSIRPESAPAAPSAPEP